MLLLNAYAGLAQSLAGLGERSAAVVPARRAVQLFQERDPMEEAEAGAEDGFEFAQSLNRLGALLVDSFQFEGVSAIYDKALEISKRVRGPEHASTLTIEYNYGVLLHYTKESSITKAHFERIVEIMERTVPPENADYYCALAFLADHCAAAKDLARAEHLYLRSVQIRERVLGPDHQDTWSTRWRLLRVIHAQGRDPGQVVPQYRVLRRILTTYSAQPATSPKTGRNEVCPCGSGKKFKKCCGR